eukprot:scaffold39957_cov78-Attheya_sp.AAC.1
MVACKLNPVLYHLETYAWSKESLLPSKLLTPKEREKLKTGKGLRNDYLNMYHDSLRLILKELHELQIHDRET